ncbi:ATP-binding protein [uncultured Mitsuokella sp.]|uniref:ATP-binding protein n=1 Tax=uncultured Mitsuokella sp. TaxID=453120 RepID=UPI0026DC6134|nr:ATP-binding protein [uncultured Mitsuokella sp.]
MNLFDTTGELPKLGYRLQRLEVYNWGTFDQRVWSFELGGEAALLTGDVGSGKSTLVDAILTLLVPPRKVTYNKAADADARERDLASYVLGYYAQRRTADGGGRPLALRDRSQYSVILGIFADENFGKTMTLAQVFWFRDESIRYPSRFYVVANKELHICDAFSKIGPDMRRFKKELSSQEGLEVFDDYPAYARVFRRAFGLHQEQAMELFQQTVSMKKVDSLTDFVRQSMLDVPDTDAYVENLLHHYHDLEAAHQSVLQARSQQELLKPLVEDGMVYRRLQRRRQELIDMREVLPAWLAGMACEALSKKAESLQQEQAARQREFDDEQRRQEALEQEFLTASQALAQHGGQRLSELVGRIRLAEAALAAREEAAAKYGEALSSAGVTGCRLPQSLEEFAENREKITALRQAAEQRLDEIGDERATARSNEAEMKKRAETLATELTSLRGRQSNIPHEYVRLREQLAESLNLAPSEMPFVGELLEVREDEQEWEGALERLLHSFGLSLIVPQTHYGEVANWLERHPLHLKLVYYCVDELVQENLPEVPQDAACSKLNLREDSSYANWLQAELARRFAHTCVEEMKEFRHARFALTKAGQIKTGGRRHEKDDRRDIGDRSRYILGFSNQRKVQALEAEQLDLQEEERYFHQAAQKLKREERDIQGKLRQFDRLTAVTDFDAIDTEPLRKSLGALREERRQLEQGNEDYRLQQQRVQDLQERRAAQQKKMYLLRDALTRGAQSLQDLSGRMQAAKASRDAVPSTKWQAISPLLERDRPDKSGDAQSGRDLRMAYEAWLKKHLERADEELAARSSRMVSQMALFRERYPQAGRDLAVTPEALRDYEAILERLQADDLPRFESRFRALLRENTIKQMTLFRAHLEAAARDIEERIARINTSLYDIDYNPGRYIQMECVQAADERVRSFRMDLAACTDAESEHPDEAAAYGEQQFQKVSAMVQRLEGRPGHTGEDLAWRRHVTDVRNWFAFAAAEHWREDDSEYEHYTDSGGKSGGQKEKLAYTILAASIVYNFGIEGKHAGEQSFRFVAIDEAFLKSSDEAAAFGLELFRKLDLQLLVVTPLLKLATIEPYVRHVGFVYFHDDEHRSYLQNLSIEELRAQQDDPQPANNNDE